MPIILPRPWFNVVPSLEKLQQAVVVRNEQANLQLTLNKGARSAGLTIFVTGYRSSMNQKILLNVQA